MNKLKTSLAAITLITAAALPVAAHHAVNAQFDVTKNVALTGVLTKVELINPHSYIHFDVKGTNGKVVNWSIETGAPGALKRAGLSVRDALKAGQTYKIVVSPARNGTATGLMSAITLPDGKSFSFGAQNNIDAGRELSENPNR